MLRQDGQLINFRDNLNGLYFFFGPRGVLTSLLPWFIDYLRPGFHP